MTTISDLFTDGLINRVIDIPEREERVNLESDVRDEIVISLCRVAQSLCRHPDYAKEKRAKPKQSRKLSGIVVSGFISPSPKEVCGLCGCTLNYHN